MPVKRFLFLGLMATLLGGQGVLAAPPAPPPPDEYRVGVRFRIHSGRSERYARFLALRKHVVASGMKIEPNPEAEPDDFSSNMFAGTIASSNVRRLFDDSHVKSLLLMPTGYQLPENGDQPVKVQLELASGMPPERQRMLGDQVREKLQQLGFREAVGYDHRNFKRMVGTIPAKEVHTLLKDLRSEPSGWLVPARPIAELPEPIRSVTPILITEVIPEPDGFPPAKPLPAIPPPPPEEQEHLLKITPELAALVAKEDEAAKPVRMEVIFNHTPAELSRGLKVALTKTAPGLVLEGQVGPVLTVLTPAKNAPALAALPYVSSVRLARSGLPFLLPAGPAKEGNQNALRASGLSRLHALGPRGRGVRVAVIDGDFRGYDSLVGKQLPARTQYLDLTRERNPDFLPEPVPGDPQALGHGTQVALAVALAAPNATITLIRIDPAALNQFETVVRSLRGSALPSEDLTRRVAELASDKERIQQRRSELLIQREAILRNFGQDEETVKKREAHFDEWKGLLKAESALLAREDRYLDLVRALQELKGIRVVACPLIWNEGHPGDGSSVLTRYLDDHPPRQTIWFQSAGDQRGKAWGGLVTDRDNNGVLEFAPANAPLRKERWTSELNFLGWQPLETAKLLDLPDKATIKITMQWREPHDASFYQQGEDIYLKPLANLKLMVLRQRDPMGKQIPADDLEVIAQSSGLPQRVNNLPGSATYEQILQFTVETAGRYAIRLEGKLPETLRPREMAPLPIMKMAWELRPRLLLDVVDAPSRQSGRPIFEDYVTDEGSIGMPADAHAVITVGAVNSKNQLMRDGSRGPALNLELLAKPNVLSYGDLRFVPPGKETAPSTSLATGFAAGLAASALSAGAPPDYLLKILKVKPGEILRLPEDWPAMRGQGK